MAPFPVTDAMAFAPENSKRFPGRLPTERKKGLQDIYSCDKKDTDPYNISHIEMRSL